MVTFFVGLRLVVDDRLQLSALGGELVSQLGALDVAIDEGKFSHVISPLVTEREAEGGQQRLGFFVGLRGGGDADVQPTQRVDLVVLDFGENDLLFHPDVVVATAVERATEIPRKSRTRGSATATRRSRNSYMR